MSNRDRFILQFLPIFYLLFIPNRLPLNQISLGLAQRNAGLFQNNLYF